jgi:hypothetical protein
VRHVLEGQTCLRNQRQKKKGENKRRDGEVNKKKKKSRKSINVERPTSGPRNLK